MSKPDTDFIEVVTKKFKKQYREDLYNECYIFLFDNPETTEKELYNFCRRYLYRYALKNPSLDISVSDQDGEETTFADLVPSRTNVDKQIEDRQKLELISNKLKRNEKLIFELYYHRDIPVKEISKLYSPITGIKSIPHIYQILSKFKNDSIQLHSETPDASNVTRPKKIRLRRSRIDK